MGTDIATGILIIIVSGLFLYFAWQKLEGRKKKRLEFALLSFQSHTNPHFIKNVLQAINWFILNNEKNMASDYLCDFSRLMDDILLFSKKKIVTLQEKLKFLDLYIRLQHLRDKEKFDYIGLNDPGNMEPTIKVDEHINPEVFFLPPLLIHPFVENAIEHGLKPKSTKGFLLVEFIYEKSKLICRIADNGIGIKASKERQRASKISRSNIGIINTKKRIEIIRKLYGINIITTIKELYPNEKEPGTLVTLEFPMPIGFSPESGMPKEVYRL